MIFEIKECWKLKENNQQTKSLKKLTKNQINQFKNDEIIKWKQELNKNWKNDKRIIRIPKYVQQSKKNMGFFKTLKNGDTKGHAATPLFK